MQFSFLGYSVKKIMEFNLDVKDVTILRYFDDFRKSGKMSCEVIDGVKHYWISYQNIENELPFLGLGKRTIMMRMLKLRDLGILSHYTKKEGGTFSFYALGEKYKDLLYVNESSNDNEVIKNGQSYHSNKAIISEQDNNISNSKIHLSKKRVVNNEEGVLNNKESIHELKNLSTSNLRNEEGLSKNNDRGYAEKCSTKTNILNNSSTIVTNIYNNIKDNISSIINYLNLKVGVMYKPSSTKTISLIKARLREGFTLDDFKTVIDKKVKAWNGTIFEQYLTPFTLFGDKFEIYLNQKIVKQEESKKNNSYENKKSYGSNKNLRFHNFKGRDYDYDDLEKKLLGWDN
jgi:uncharacterized phage protein (TIGR02220 family)